ncbi:MAG TPA: metal ABC transporter permease [Candidatus Pacebacteria bacterium]|nr:metal ABC transporter permease [Candidatus Paceibacterota bacterium]
MIEILSLQFMQKAIIAGMFLGVMMPFLGVFVTLKRMAFFGDGIAHASLAGIALGLLMGVAPFTFAVPFAIAVGALIYFLERYTKVSSDSAIGTVFTTSMAVGIILLSLKSGYQPDLISFLFGNILTISSVDVWVVAFGSIFIMLFLIIFYRPLTLLIIDPVQAWLQHVRTGFLEFVFYLITALAVVFGVKILGIILVSALLIIPASTAKLFSRNFVQLIMYSIVLGFTAVLCGLFLSYYLNLPSGASIILFSATFFFLSVMITSLWRK